VSSGEIGFIERCGKFNRTANPGCNILWPCCCETLAGVVSLRLQQLQISCESKTSDNVFIVVVVSIQYVALEVPAKRRNVAPTDLSLAMPKPSQPSNSHNFQANVVETFYKLSNPHEQIRTYVENVVRSTIPTITLDLVFETKDHVAKAIGDSVSATMEDFGFKIIKALVTDIVPDERVKESMNAINAAKRLRIAATDEAESEKIKVVKAAEADAESAFLQAKGIAKSRKEVMKGMKESIAEFEKDVPGTHPSELMNMIMMSQYFEMLKEVGTHGGNTSIFIPYVPGAVTSSMADISQALQQANMESSAAGIGIGMDSNVIRPGPRTTMGNSMTTAR